MFFCLAIARNQMKVIACCVNTIEKSAAAEISPMYPERKVRQTRTVLEIKSLFYLLIQYICIEKSSLSTNCVGEIGKWQQIDEQLQLRVSH